MSNDRFNADRRKLMAGLGALTLASFARPARSAETNRVGSSAQRVIVVGGAIAEVVYALGKAQTLVATDTTCTFPSQALALPKVGYQRTLSAEGLLSFQPTLILASAEAGPSSALDQASRMGVRIVSFDESHDVASVRNKIQGTARALDAAAAGQALLERFDSQWTQTVQRIARAQRKPLRVLFLLNPGGNQPMVAGQHTAADAMLTYAGATNAIQDFAGYRALSPEALAACQPDVVLTTDDTLQASGGKQNLLAGAGFQLTPAGRNGRIVSLDTLFLLGFGPRLPDAVAELHRRLFTS
ncbi:heme/hemin ABC transporter substrate-binding protein [Paraburkholderia terrae]